MNKAAFFLDWWPLSAFNGMFSGTSAAYNTSFTLATSLARAENQVDLDKPYAKIGPFEGERDYLKKT